MTRKIDPKHTRQKRHRAGQRAEAVAAFYLNLKGYHIVARRYKSPHGEIDLIAKRARRIIFVEVKYRQTYEEAAHSISAHQRGRIVRAAKFWLAQNASAPYEQLSFDALLLVPWRWPHHLQNAFNENE